MKNPLCVYVVDDDEAIRDSLGTVLETAGFYYQVFESAENFLDAYKPGQPGCLVLDVNLPGLNGHELQAELNRRDINLPIIFLTAYGDIPMSVRAIKAGAADFLTKPVPSILLIEKIQDLLKHEAEKQYEVITIESFKKHLNSLTKRERQILPMALSGLPNKQIARHLGINYRTVENYRIQILKKTETSNFLELASQLEAHHIRIKPCD